MIFTTFDIGVTLITPNRFVDNRGYFAETFNYQKFSDAGINCDFVQDNQSLSREVGTLRGLHFQKQNHAQAKIVRCGNGSIYDVAVDIRQGSPTYKEWVGFELSVDNGHQLFIPEGFAHGFLTLMPDSEIVYKCSKFYNQQSEGVIRFDDPDIGISWPLDLDFGFILSEKDRNAPYLRDIEPPFT